MGTCDLIPGISGGTIAFITGIYSRLINSIKSFSPIILIHLFNYLKEKNESNKKKLQEDFRKLDLVFLLTLGLGIGTAIFFGSKAIGFLLEEYFVYTISFFVGLIVASSKIIYDDIQNRKIKNMGFGAIGFIIGSSFALLIPVNVNPSLPYVFLGGFVSVSAMFLPGISGAFILLIMGLYEFMIKEVLRDIPGHLDFFLVSASGALLGAFFISRAISFLFQRDKCKTLYVLLGLVLGSLIVPLRKIAEEITEFTPETSAMLLFFFFFGLISVIIVNRFKENKNLC